MLEIWKCSIQSNKSLIDNSTSPYLSVSRCILRFCRWEIRGAWWHEKEKWGTRHVGNNRIGWNEEEMLGVYLCIEGRVCRKSFLQGGPLRSRKLERALFSSDRCREYPKASVCRASLSSSLEHCKQRLVSRHRVASSSSLSVSTLLMPLPSVFCFSITQTIPFY